MSTYVQDHMRQTLAGYVLSCTATCRFFAAYRLGPDANTGMGVVRILFTSAPLAEQIIITGDLHPGNGNGILSNGGYGIGWFGSRKSEHYLCEKFLRTEFVPAKAREALLNVVTDYANDDLELDHGEVDELTQALAASIDPDNGDPSNPVRSHEAFYEWWTEFFEDTPEDRGFDYHPDTAGWLCAIQQRFVELYQEKETT